MKQGEGGGGLFGWGGWSSNWEVILQHALVTGGVETR
jgi:hypothetical protein